MSQSIFIIIISIIIFDYLLERFLDYLNDKNRSDELPAELAGIYEPEKYKKSQEYDRVTSKFGFYTSTFSLLLMLLMLFFDGFAFVDSFVRNYLSVYEITDTAMSVFAAILFFGILALASDILGTPFSVYNTFVIEE